MTDFAKNGAELSKLRATSPHYVDCRDGTKPVKYWTLFLDLFMKNIPALILSLVAVVLATFLTSLLNAAERPHVILIMVDDMGFSDLGYHGGEIDTPNLDGLARGGVRFSQFYNSGRCCPTRATLMTGLHPHQTGIGHMTQAPGRQYAEGTPPAYQGYLNRECATIAEILNMEVQQIHWTTRASSCNCAALRRHRSTCSFLKRVSA